MKPAIIGVVGAGAMGSGIAQVAILNGFRTLLHDAQPAGLATGGERIELALERGIERDRWNAGQASVARDRLVLESDLSGLAECDLVIEAAPEDLEIKRSIFAALEEICRPDAVLATNTSSLEVSAIAAATSSPERVVGMHFFNPVPAMRLIEVVPAMQSSLETVEIAAETGRLFGKTVIIAQDSPGFVVNRCARPFYGEALRLVQEGVSTPEQIDRICRLGGGFRMGPFELMDLVGIDVGLAVAESFTTRSFGEARWKPSPLQSKMVAAGRLGRKTKHGWFRYDVPTPAPDLSTTVVTDPQSRSIRIVGETRVAAELKILAEAASHKLMCPEPEVTIFTDGPEAVECPVGVPVLACFDRSLIGHSAPEAVGFSFVPIKGNRLVEVCGTPATPEGELDLATELFESMGLHVEQTGDGPGMVLNRIVAQLANEACFALGEGVASSSDIDRGMTLGLNFPRGPFDWGDAIGWPRLNETIDGLWEERREERYRPAPALRRLKVLDRNPDA